MPVFSGNAIELLDFNIHCFVLFELVVFFQPTGVFEQRVGVLGYVGKALMRAFKRKLGADVVKRVHRSILLQET
ncbi:hypothetical protein D3C77_602770 [compost metagenome]